jgi:hypothetical protein
MRRFALVLLAALSACKKPPAAAQPADAAAPPAASAAPAARDALPAATQPFARVVAAREGSMVVVAASHVYVADEDATAIVAVDRATMKVAGTTALAGRPAQMIATADGRLAVALRDEHVVAFFAPRADDAAKLVEKARIETSEEPIGLALAPDGKMLAVTAGWGHALDVIAQERKVRTVDLEREPRGVTITDDGSQAIVSHAVANVASIVTLSDGTVKKTVLGRPQTDIGDKAKGRDPMQDLNRFFGVRFERHARHGYASLRLPGEKERYVLPHALVSPGAPPGREFTSSNGYGSGPGNGGGFTATWDELLQIFPNVSFTFDVLDPKRIDAPVNGLIDELMEGKRACFLPRAAAATVDRLFVACAGTSELLEYKTKGLRVVAAPVRWSVPEGPMGLAVDAKGENLYVWSQHARSLVKLDLGKKRRDDDTIKDKDAPAASFADVPARGPWSDARVLRGRSLFFACNDERLTADRRPCASCHPDGRDDGLTWSTPDGPRQTMFLAGRLDRATSFGWHGTHTSFEEHVKLTVKNLKGTGLPDEDIEALRAYARAMSPPSRRAPPNADRGKQIFFSSETRCSTCHAESTAFGGKEPQDVASGTPFDTTKKFQVPSLKYVGGSAPYFHDGRYKTLEELIKASDGKMGHTGHLAESDVSDLAAFLRTL